MDSNLIFAISFFWSLIVFGLIGKWYVIPHLSLLPCATALTPLLILHSFRHIGMVFLVPGVVSSTLPTPFAYPAAYGDLLAAVLAFVVLIALRLGLRWAVAGPLVWIFNLVGTVDLLYALFQGTQLGLIEQLGQPILFQPLRCPHSW